MFIFYKEIEIIDQVLTEEEKVEVPKVEEEVPQEEIVPQEPKVEEEVPQSNMEDINTIVEYMLLETLGSSGYSVDLEVNGNQVNIVVVASDINMGNLSREQINQLVREASLDVSQDSLAQSVKNIYVQQGYSNMMIRLITFDVNGTVLYETYA